VSEHPVSVRSYRPGDWFGIIGERAVVILPPSEKNRVASLWELVDDGAGFDVTLDALISGGLRDLPSFVLVSTGEGETKVVLRGPARAVFTVEGDEVELEGSSATTWVERSLHGVERMWISVDDDVETPLSYAVDGGLFRISALEEAPAHEGAPEYDPGPAAEEGEHAWAEPELPEGSDVEPPEDPVDAAEAEPEEPAGLDAIFGRSPEPPSWTPEPPIAPPAATAPPAAPTPEPATPFAWAAPTDQPETEAMTVPPDTDPDDLTATGTWARLVISNGETIDVDRAIVIGRAPEARRFTATEQPRLVTVPSPHLEVSATHVEVRPGSGADHGSAVVTDLGSTNGTVLVQPGMGPEDLEPGVAVTLVPGAVIDLGDGVTIQVLQH
jgi:hypothetical protein